MILYRCRLCSKNIEVINNRIDMSYHYQECMVICLFCDKYYSRNDIINHIEECNDRKECLRCNEFYPLRFNNAHNEYYCRRLDLKK